MTWLLVVRHAQSEWNAAGRWQGRADPPLSPAGIDQTRLAGEGLPGVLAELGAEGPVTSLWSSDLERARETARIIGEAVGYDQPRREVPQLGEHDVGDWSGLTHPEIEARWPGLIEAWGSGRLASTPGGEHRAAFDRRVQNGIRTVVSAAPPGIAVVVSHGGVIRSISRWLTGADGPVQHLEGVALRVGEDGDIRYEDRVRLLTAAAVRPVASEGAGQAE